MRTITALNSHSTHRIMHYVRLAFLSGASTAFLCHSGVAQQSPENITATDNSGKAFTYNYTAPVKNTAYNTAVYRQSQITTGPGYKYNITAFVYNTLPVNSIQYSDKSAVQMSNSATALYQDASQLSGRAKEARVQVRNANTRWLAVALSKKADSLDALADNDRLQATVSLVNAAESQYETNQQSINHWEHNSTYSSDLRTTANLITQNAEFYYNKAITEIQQSNSSPLIYLKQSFMETAQKDMEEAVIKQQNAENIYISMDNSKSVAIAEKIDSILTLPDKSKAFNGIVFCVQVGAYSNLVPMQKANELLKIAGLGVTKHTENGVTIFTIGNYTSFTCADMLSQELIEDGFKNSTVITLNQYSKEEPTGKYMVATK